MTTEEMITCSRYPLCAIRFTKEFKNGNVSFFSFFPDSQFLFKVTVKANLIQSLTIIMARIKEISAKITGLNREIEVKIIEKVSETSH